jgi:diguanylate cyclase (GGDEF)-like protein/PAS domain S-box-containing protein
MPKSPTEGSQEIAATSYSRLQQELIAVRNQRDRQIGQLIRLNRLSDALLADLDTGGLLEAFAEAIVDVLDIGIGALWLFDGVPAGGQSFQACGVAVPRSAWAGVGSELLALLPRDSLRRALVLTPTQTALLEGPVLEDALVCRCIGRDGRCRALLLAANSRSLAGMAEPVWEESLEVLSLLAEKLAAHIDHLGDRQLIEGQMDQLQASEERLEAVLKGANDGWWDLDLTSGSCFLSARWQEMLGDREPSQQVDSDFWRYRIHPGDLQRFDWLYEQLLSGRNQTLECELRLCCNDGGYLPVLIRGTVTRLLDGTPRRFAGSMQDLSERKRHETQVHRLAFYDSLTELPNRRLFQARLTELIRSSRQSGDLFALVMLDLDHFKTLNDTHGHAAGDQLLCQVAQRLQQVLRSDDLVARLGGDEFVALLDHLGGDPQEAETSCRRLAETIIRAIAEPISLNIGTVHQSASIGIAISDRTDLSGSKLLQRADLSLYEAKAAGRNTVRLFRDDMQQRLDRRSALETRIRQGLELDQFTPAYQLQVDSNRFPVGVEALLRWPQETQPWISPAEFIPVAQETGLIHRLGEGMTRKVFHQLVAWENLGLPEDFRISINLSTAEFLHPGFVDQVLHLINNIGVNGRRLRLEITEDSVLSDLAKAAERMHQLIEYAIDFSLDDFGTGYSSFTYLRYLPVAEVKIDHGFVRRFLHQPQDAAIVRAIVELGRSLGLRVVAEGVETEAQLQGLQEVGCNLFQGYLFDRPQLESEFGLLERLAGLSGARS